MKIESNPIGIPKNDTFPDIWARPKTQIFWGEPKFFGFGYREIRPIVFRITENPQRVTYFKLSPVGPLPDGLNPQIRKNTQKLAKKSEKSNFKWS